MFHIALVNVGLECSDDDCVLIFLQVEERIHETV